ncbi:ATP-binding protein [Kitasatospora sp. NPDC052868]|uniref:ATP-binding protein n=1 Tax=Kitasatospora sp. NPDC052868 TaxID=3364060 RepID=UPI0037C68E1C
MFVVISPLDNARFPVPLEWGVPPGVGAVPGARRLVMAIVRDWGVVLSEDVLQDLELCASELIANALVHTGERCTVTVRRRVGRLRVEVADRCPELPRRERDAESTGGRGLLLVEALAQAWGWYPSGAGKVVWFDFLESTEAPWPPPPGGAAPPPGGGGGGGGGGAAGGAGGGVWGAAPGGVGGGRGARGGGGSRGGGGKGGVCSFGGPRAGGAPPRGGATAHDLRGLREAA